MKTLFRWAFRLFLLCVIVVIAGILLLDTLAREVLEYQLRKETGLEASIGKLHIGLLQPEFTIENLVIYNSPEFGGSPFIDMPELHVEYDRDLFFSRKLHCHFVRFNLAEINFVDDKNGHRNLDVLGKKLGAAVGFSPPNQDRSQPAGPKRDYFTGIDILNLTLGKATHLDMRQPQKVDELKINLRHQIFTKVKSQDDLYGILLVSVLRSGIDLRENWLHLFPQPKNEK